MIYLNVDSYCQECPELEVELDKNANWSGGKYRCDTFIRCIHRDRCRIIKENIEKDMKKDDM